MGIKLIFLQERFNRGLPMLIFPDCGNQRFGAIAYCSFIR